MPTNDVNNSIIKVDGVGFGDRSLGELRDITKPKTDIVRLRALNDYFVFEVPAVVPYTQAADANYYTIFYIANQQCFLLEAKLRHGANSTSGVVDVEKLTSGTARGSGVSMIASTFSIASGANATQRRLPSATLANVQLAPGDSVALKATGTLTNAEHVTVTILLGIIMKNMPVSANI